MKIGIENPQKAFDIHLSDEDNKRVIFSGQFGAGKTYFLQHYFKVNEQYKPFWISPVKYSASQNEDIFEYIKIDIANQLLLDPKIYSIVKREFKELAYVEQFIRQKTPDGVKMLLQATKFFSITNKVVSDGIDGIGDLKDVTEVAESSATNIFDLINSYKSFKDKINENLKTESEVLSSFTKNSVNIRGSVFEDDVVTQSIRKALQFCANGKKKNVLIIDDLDRLDPEHIFRILNILSVHNDHYDADNKFGFDKIILVCDIMNIRHIYEYKYGPKVDFLGYIDKYFSTEIFYYNNISAVQFFCVNSLTGVVCDDDSERLLGMYLSYFVEQNIFNVRNVIKYKLFKEDYEEVIYGPYPTEINIRNPLYYRFGQGSSIEYVDKSAHTFFISSKDYPFIKAIKVLITIAGSYDNLIYGLKNMKIDKNKTFDREYLKSILICFAPILHHIYNLQEPPKIMHNFHQDAQSHTTFLFYPKISLFGRTITIKVGWSHENVYTSDVSYFRDVHMLMKKVDSRDYIAKAQEKDLNLQTAVDYLITILQFLERSNTLQNMGVTISNSK